MNQDLDFVLQFVVFFSLMLFVACITFLKCRGQEGQTNNTKHYFLAGRNLGWISVSGSLIMANISAEQIVGMNGAQTLLVAWWEIGAVLGLIILARFLLPVYYRYNCTTTTELLEHKFEDKSIRAIVSLFFLVGYIFILLPVILYTGSLFMKSLFGLEISLLSIALFFAFVGSLYSILGGLRAIAISDTINGVGLLAMGTLVTIFAMNRVAWDFSGIPPSRFSLIGDNQSAIPWHTLLTGMIFIQVFYWGTNMAITQRALAAKSVREAQKGLYATIMFKLFIPIIVVIPGLIAFKLYGEIGDLSYGRLVSDTLPSWLSGAFAAVMAGAILSSFNSCLNSSSALYICDIHQKYFNPKANIKRLARITGFFFTIIPVSLVPFYAQSASIVETMQQLNGLYTMPVLAAFICAFLLKKVKPSAVKLGLLAGILLYAVFIFYWNPLHYIHLMAITLGFSVLCTVLANVMLKDPVGLADPKTS